MKKSRIEGLNAYLNDVRSIVTQYWVTEQTNRLIEYAKEKIQDIANDIQGRGYKMDRTGNLLDSLCWGVSYDGKLSGFGFYREEKATKDAHMHELWPEIADYYPVYGRKLAKDFVKRYGNKDGRSGWTVFFAILAPYWSFWENGHKNVLTKKFEQFSVMAEFYDRAKTDLKPAKVTFFHIPYTYHIDRIKKSIRNFGENPYKEKRHDKSWPRRN